MIEKHFTLDRNMPGPDHQASIEPGELRAMVAGIRRVEAALGDGVKRPVAAEVPNIPVRGKACNGACAAGRHAGGRRRPGSLRPGSGLPAERAAALAGRTLARAVDAGQMVGEEHFCTAP